MSDNFTVKTVLQTFAIGFGIDLRTNSADHETFIPRHHQPLRKSTRP